MEALVHNLLKHLVTAYPQNSRDGLLECRFIVCIAIAGVLMLAVYLGPMSGQI